MTEPLLSNDATFTEFLADELAREERRADSLDTRAVASVSGSAAVLAFGAAAVSLGGDERSAGPSVAFWISVGCLLTAIGLATFASVPRLREVGDVKALTQTLRRHGRYDPEVVRTYCARVRSGMLGSLRKGNHRTALILTGSQALQVAGVVALLLAL